ncbi:DUF6083 domain-containing protein [Kitasatospora sp. NPDC005856]|uniref:DUF6083 domain-containing protein n=1 Tax=Kitasatospora sp. NPDC005856 TaxID=3154566 RepID=UPI0034110BB5
MSFFGKDPEQQTGGLRNGWIHRGSPSKVLRARAAGRCKWCGNRVAWYDRHDGGRIPLAPVKFPSHRVPPRFQWSVDLGMAATGALFDWCFLAHPAICPAIEHEGLPQEFEDMVRVLGVRMRKMIDSGEFVPADPPLDETEVAEPEPAAAAGADERHVISHGSLLRICPGRIEDLRCVAEGAPGQRCERPVFHADDGRWVEVVIPPAKGRAGKLIMLTFSGRMWAWEIDPLDFREASSWMWQRCLSHASAAEVYERELVDFSTIRHHDFILRHRPAGYEPAVARREPRTVTGTSSERIICAGDGCHNGTVVEVDDGWLCWRCAPKNRRRQAVLGRLRRERVLPQPAVAVDDLTQRTPGMDAAFLPHERSDSERLVWDGVRDEDPGSPQF